ncbi:MAG: glucose-6-phosphate isomerase [Patescibacteria group bacterium]|nr:glucose-6-phosphate isomerase [Patescibacteria group bacterium]MCL5093693.1 glucose-6-phosphate isomerase [Patescibacteria group bacterium]
MIDLEEKCGLPILLNGEVIKGKEGFELPEPDFRRLEDFRKVLMPGSELAGPEIAYSMFRGVGFPEGLKKLGERNLRYDITVALDGTIGQEYIKTVGHYHPFKVRTKVTFPEIYEVIFGKAHYLIQKVEDAKVVDYKIIEANPGDKVLIPPGYGHITINPGTETLVMANVTDSTFKSIYKPLEKLSGGCIYELLGGEFVKNKNYEIPFEPKISQPEEFQSKFDIDSAKPLYQQVVENPEKFDLLVNPEKYFQ